MAIAIDDLTARASTEFGGASFRAQPLTTGYRVANAEKHQDLPDPWSP
jgi:hypothetical protein